MFCRTPPYCLRQHLHHAVLCVSPPFFFLVWLMTGCKRPCTWCVPRNLITSPGARPGTVFSACTAANICFISVLQLQLSMYQMQLIHASQHDSRGLNTACRSMWQLCERRLAKLGNGSEACLRLQQVHSLAELEEQHGRYDAVVVAAGAAAAMLPEVGQCNNSCNQHSGSPDC